MNSSDGFAVKIVVCTLAVIAVGGFASISYLAFTGTAIPDQLDRLIAGAVGALIGILAATRTGTTDVQVVNEGPGEAVPVAESPKVDK